MKLETALFKVTVTAHNIHGEIVKIVVSDLAKRSDVVSLANSVDVMISYQAPYKMITEKSYPINAEKAEHYLGIRLGEFTYEPHINIVRL